MNKIRVLFVCMGNICRSPLAHGVFEHLVADTGFDDRVEVDSAGTHAYHVGEAPDPRSQEVALRNRIDLSGQRARKVVAGDFERFDYVLAMDRQNHQILAQLCPPGLDHKLRMFMEFAPELNVAEVPDPYYGGPTGFDYVFDLVRAASDGLLSEIRRTQQD